MGNIFAAAKILFFAAANPVKAGIHEWAQQGKQLGCKINGTHLESRAPVLVGSPEMGLLPSFEIRWPSSPGLVSSRNKVSSLLCHLVMYKLYLGP